MTAAIRGLDRPGLGVLGVEQLEELLGRGPVHLEVGAPGASLGVGQARRATGPDDGRSACSPVAPEAETPRRPYAGVSGESRIRSVGAAEGPGPLPFRERVCRLVESSNRGSLHGDAASPEPSPPEVAAAPEPVDLGGERLHDRLHLGLGRAGVRADLLPAVFMASSTILRSCARAWPMRSRASRLTSSTISSATSCAWLNSWTTWSFTRSPTCSYSSSSACTRAAAPRLEAFVLGPGLAELPLRGLHLVGQQVEVPVDLVRVEAHASDAGTSRPGWTRVSVVRRGTRWSLFVICCLLTWSGRPRRCARPRPRSRSART